MKKNLYSIYDKVGCVFHNPFYAINDGSAIRSFTESQDQVKNITEYELYYILQYDDSNGDVTHHECTRIYTGLDVVNSQKNNVE